MMKIDRVFCVCIVTLVCASLAHANNDEWITLTGSDWSTNANWADGSAPHASDQATFDKPGTYRVDYLGGTTTTIQDLFVSGGNVTLTKLFLGVGQINVNSTGGGQDVVVADGATFTLTIGSSANHGLTLIAGDTLYVQGAGTLNVFQGSTVTAANLIDNFGGNIVVDGKSVDSISSVLNASSSATIGGLLGTSSLSYRNLAQGSLAPNGTVFVGSDAAGILNIDTQAAVEVGSLKVGTTGATGTINVNSLGTTLGQIGNDTVTVGASGTINVGTITSGGTFTTGTGLMTVNATGTVNVGSASTSGTLNAQGNILISGGTINVTGGTLHSSNIGLNGGQLIVGTNGVVDGPLSIAGGGLAAFAGTSGLVDVSVTGSGSLLNLQSASDALASGATWNLSSGGGLSPSGDFHLNSGTISVDGAGSTVIIAAAKTLRIGDVVGTTMGVMNVTNEGALTVGAGGTTLLTNHGTLNINGGTVDLKTLNNSGGKINLMAGSLSYLGNLTVGTGGPLGSDLVLNANSQLTLSGATTVDASRTLTLSGGTLTTASLVVNGAFNFIAGTLTITQAAASINTPIVSGASSTINLSANNVSLGLASSFTGFDYGGALNVGPNSVTLNSATYARLGTITTFAGGTITAPNGIALATGSNLLGHGAVNARVAAELGSVIEADGALALGDATSPAGYVSNGELHTKQFAVTLNSSAQAALGNLTTLGNGASAGTLNATNGLFVDFGHSITGFGTVNSSNAFAKRTIINGVAQGNSIAQPLTFSGYVKGDGTFNNVNFTGTFSPGLSPTLTSAGNLAFAVSSTLEIELGGTTPGSTYDQIQAIGQLSFAGTLQISLIDGFNPSAGNSFDILDWGSLSGTFNSLVLPSLAAGLTWNTSALYTSGVLSVAAAGVPGDYNGNGIVDAADYSVWRDKLGSSTTLPNDTTPGTVTQADYDVWKSNFGNHSGSGAGATAAVPEPESIVSLLAGATTLLIWRRATVS